MLPQLTLVLGGAASGKSAWAERLAEKAHSQRIYLATAEARDTEMRARVAQHRARRGSGWRTVEAGRDLAGALNAVAHGGVVLVDCATMWLSGLLETAKPLAPALADLRRAIQTCAAPVIMVSNELGQGIVPENALARRFRQQHGEMNQQLARNAGLVVLIAAGLPLVLKGTLPEGMT